MKRLLAILLLSHTLVIAQNYQDSLKAVEEAFKSFKYAEVIKRTPSLLIYGEFSADTLKNIYMMKGIAHYALQEDTLAKYSFNEILKIDPDFFPDSISTSPKIIDFFANVKKQFKAIPKEDPSIVKDTIGSGLPDFSSFYNYSEKVRTTMFRSLIFPGLGHIYANDGKGWFISAAAGVSFLSSVYFLIDTNNKRDSYLNEKDLTRIDGLYNEYNSAFKARNISLLTFTAIWLFAQIDLLTSDILNFSPDFLIVDMPPREHMLSIKISF